MYLAPALEEAVTKLESHSLRWTIGSAALVDNDESPPLMNKLSIYWECLI